ncbi:hypothetical protein CCACVL1_18243 [Corchorus capsularis]|uniref:Uncharacterized protein n=1 Tax=Corchorus capsularis TaxID=210143 RepID=A0A1R3HM48_COCAP|nr:hypothetical protein CCACVL1_18243 [Corchorus capsularis]
MALGGLRRGVGNRATITEEGGTLKERASLSQEGGYGLNGVEA